MRWIIIWWCCWTAWAEERVYHFDDTNPFAVTQMESLENKDCCQLRAPSRTISREPTSIDKPKQKAVGNAALKARPVQIVGKIRRPKVQFTQVEKPRMEITTESRHPRGTPTFDLDLVDQY